MTGPQLPFADSLHAEKYRSPGEGFREAMNRVSSALSDSPEHYHEFREILLGMRFLPAGRVQTAMGSTKNVTPYNCYVAGTIEDSFVHGNGSIMDRAKEAAATMRMGGGIGYDFSTLRPKGAMIKKLQSQSSGPLAFMEIFDAVCRCVASSGHRRGAQMGVMRVDHPDIEEFLHAKQNQNKLTGFNISIAVTDEFMEAVSHQRAFSLRWGGQVYREVDAAALWENIMRSTWDWAEPGVLFIDTINRLNNLRYCEKIAATNPCGEQPLPPHGACLLGSFNLTRYLSDVIDIRSGRRSFDWHQFQADIPHVVRAMDNIVDRALYPLYEQEKEAKSKRRMGLGVTGLANTIESMGYLYGSPEFVEMQGRILLQLSASCYEASIELAKEKGPFPLFDAEHYTKSNFLSKDLIELLMDKGLAEHGIRNSHLTSIAPTGTISMTADNVSSGIEPVFAYDVERIYIGPDGPQKVVIDDYGKRVLGTRGKVASEVTVDEHLAVLECASRHVDSAVSKTCNVPSDTPWEAFKGIYARSWEFGAKGCTTFNTGGKRVGILKEVTQDDDQGKTCRIDATTGRRECD
jgi:ribonucleoside-diphosphate reductase alpha chain